MKLDRFLTQGSPHWQELTTLIAAAGGRAERLGAEGARRLTRTYRRAVADLALARRAFPHEPVVGRLEDLVATARPLVYARHERRSSILDFFARDYWRLVRERPWPLAISAVALLLPFALGAWWGHADTPRAVGAIPNQFRTVLQPRSAESADLELGLEDRFLFSSLIFTNNVKVSFLAFALGITAGLGTVGTLLYNGGLFGTVTGVAIGAGAGDAFIQLVAPHGVLELTCIIVAGAAGLRMGWALVEPGLRSRRDAIMEEGRSAILIALGTAPWLVLAGFVEGLITPTGIGLSGALLLGCSLAAAYWALVISRGGTKSEAP